MKLVVNVEDFKSRLLISKIIDIGSLIGFIIFSYKTVYEIGVFILMFLVVFIFITVFYNWIGGHGTGMEGEPDYASFFSKSPFPFLVITLLLAVNLVFSLYKKKSMGRIICSIPNGV